MKNLGNMMKQVQEMQSKMADMPARLDVDDSLMKPEEKEILEDLLMAAYNEARAKVEQAVADQMKEVTGGLPLPPGFKMPGM